MDFSPTSYIIGALRFFLRTPLEQAGLKAYPAAHRLLDCIEDHLDAFPEDKKDIEDLMRIIGDGVNAVPPFVPTPLPQSSRPQTVEEFQRWQAEHPNG